MVEAKGVKSNYFGQDLIEINLKPLEIIGFYYLLQLFFRFEYSNSTLPADLCHFTAF